MFRFVGTEASVLPKEFFDKGSSSQQREVNIKETLINKIFLY